MLRKPRLPHFIIVGTQKGGTSSLFNSLRHHSDLLPPAVKETHFFDNDERYAKGIEEYQKYFPTISRLSQKKTFEITPSYLYKPLVAERIKALLPRTKVVAILRDPVSRAFSAWNMYHGFKDDPVHSAVHDPRSFAEAVHEEMKSGPKEPFAYLARGYYSEQLSRYFEQFGRENVLVLSYSDLRTDRLGFINRVCRFVGISEYTGQEKTFNAESNVRQYSSSMDPEIKELLVGHFRPYMDDLSELLGEDLGLLK